MHRHSGRRTAALAVVAATVAATAGCSLLGQECSGFAIDYAIDAHGHDSPVAAAEAVSHDGTADLPDSGWQQVGTDDAGVRLRSGQATVHVDRLSDGTWAVDSGSSC